MSKPSMPDAMTYSTPAAAMRAEQLCDDVAHCVLGRKRLPATRPSVTAGLKCPPDTWPTA